MSQEENRNLPPRPHDLTCWDEGEIVPRFMYREYDGMEEDIVDFSYSISFWREWEKNPGNEEGIKQRAERKAMARMYSLLQTGALHSAYEDALLIQLSKAQSEQWYAEIGDGIPEIGTMAELISLAVDREQRKRPGSPTYYEYRKVLNMLQALEQTALAAERQAGRHGKEAKENVAKQMVKMITTPEIQCKIRESGGVMEHILVSTEAPEIKKVELATEVLKDITDKDVSLREFRESNRVRMGQAGRSVHSPVPGSLMIMGDREIIVIESRGEGFTRAIESKLKGLVTEFDPRGGEQILKRLSGLVFAKGKRHRYVYHKGKLNRHGDGVSLPTQERLVELCNENVLPAREVINQYFANTDKSLVMMVDEITGGISPQDSITFVAKAFRVQEPVVEQGLVSRAVEEHFQVPAQMRMLWPDKDMRIILHLNEDRKLGLFLEIGDKL